MRTVRIDPGFVECRGRVESIEDFFSLLDAGAQHDSRLFLVDATDLPAAFFDLSSGFAGEFLQKVQSYGLVIAATIPDADGYSDRFKEFLREARRGPQFRAFADRETAEAWLREHAS